MVRTPVMDEWDRQAASGNKAATDPTEKLYDRIRKILALTNSPNEAEAAMAAAKLQSLLEEHNLYIADLESRGQASPGVREHGVDLGKAAFKWKLDLAEGIAEFYYCAPIVSRGPVKRVAFVGRPDNVEALQALYLWVIDQIKVIARDERRAHFDATNEHIDPLRWQVSFGEGAVERLIERMKEMKARQQEDLTRNEMGDSVGLAVHHATEASDYLEEKYGYRTDGKPTRREQESTARWQRLREEKDNLRIQCEEAGDMEPYYTAYPHERPETPEQAADREKEWAAAYLKKEARNEKRRTGGGRSGPAIDWDREEQASTARSRGRESAGKINLQPFISGGVDRKKVG